MDMLCGEPQAAEAPSVSKVHAGAALVESSDVSFSSLLQAVPAAVHVPGKVSCGLGGNM